MTLVAAQEDFIQLGPEWEALLARCPRQSVFQTPLWHHLWWEELGGDAELRLTTLREDGELVGLAPLMSKDNVLSFLGDTDLWDYHDFVVTPGREGEFFSTLLDAVGEQEWTQFDLKSVPEHSQCLEHLAEVARARGYAVEVAQEDVSPGLALPSSWDDYLMGLSKKDRHELRRKFRRLEQQANYHWYSVNGASSLQGTLDDFFALMRDSRQDKAVFLTPEREHFFQRMATELAQADLLKIFFMEIDGVRVASALCFDYSQTRFLYNSGYNPEYYPLSVGLLTKAMCLREAISEGKEYFDFLRGDEPYKYDLGAKDVTLYSMQVSR